VGACFLLLLNSALNGPSEMQNKTLKIESVEITVDGELLCTGQKLKISGIYGITGAHSRLRRSLISLMTRTPQPDLPNLQIYGKMCYDGYPITYSELKEMTNPYVAFNLHETVRSSLEFVNFSVADELMAEFNLTGLQDLELAKLNIAESKAWEAAINIAAEPKVIVLNELFCGHSQGKEYLSIIRRHQRNLNFTALLEVEGEIERELDGLVIVKERGFECISLASEGGLARYNEYLCSLLYESIVPGPCESDVDAVEECPVATRKKDRLRLKEKSFIEHRREADPLRARVSTFMSSTREGRTVHRIKKKRPVVGDKLKLCGANASCEDRQLSVLQRLTTSRIYGIDAFKAFVLARRKYLLKEKKKTDLQRLHLFFITFVYSAMLLKYRKGLAQQGTDAIITSLHSLRGSLDGLRSLTIPSTLGLILHRGMGLMAGSLRTCHSLLCFIRSLYSTLRSSTWSNTERKILSTLVYFLVFMRGGTLVYEERSQITLYMNRIYSPGTYFAHLFLYLAMSTWFPILFITYVLNLTFLYTFLVTGTFACIWINLIPNLKLKYFCVCLILTFNLLCPFNNEGFEKGFFLANSESFNLFMTCREFAFVSGREQLMYLLRMCRAFVMIYLFFCYKFSKMK
jgi:hypothetical protein